MMISQGLTIFEGTISKVSYNLLMAGSLIAVVPVLIVALIVQRRVVDGPTLGRCQQCGALPVAQFCLHVNRRCSEMQ